MQDIRRVALDTRGNRRFCGIVYLQTVDVKLFTLHVQNIPLVAIEVRVYFHYYVIYEFNDISLL